MRLTESTNGISQKDRNLFFFNRPFSTDVTSCSLINQQCWIARIFSQNILYEVLR